MSNLEDAYPVSPMQHGMLAHCLHGDVPGLYVEQLSLTIEGDVDRRALSDAWDTVIRRHAALRTAFRWTSIEQPLQIVHRRVSLDIRDVDWTARRPEDVERAWNAFAAAEAQIGFALDAAPLMRLALVRLTEARHRLLWTYHHLLIDGWSASIVLAEVAQSYERLVRGEGPALGPAASYRDYIAWIGRQDTQAARHYWRTRFAALPPPTLISIDDKGPAADPAEAPYEVDQQLPAPIARALTGFAREHEVTITTVLQAAWAAVVRAFAGERQVTFGTVVAGRPAELSGAESMVGLFITTLPTVVDVDPRAPIAAWLRAIQHDETQSRAHGVLSLAQVHEALDVPPGTALFDSVLAMQNYSMVRPGDGGPSMRVTDIRGSERTHYPLVLTAIAGESLRIRATFDPRRCTRERTTQLLRALMSVLRQLASRAVTLVGQLQILDPAQASALVDLGRGQRQDVSATAVLHEILEWQAEQRPDHVAVSYGDERITFAELNRRANRTAHALRRLGVGPESRVALCVATGIHEWIGAFGILKAGACYVPIDADLPSARRRRLLDDFAPAVFVTSRDVVPVDLACPVLQLDAIEAEADCNPGVAIATDQLAYILYTSGSTGQPKGVQVSHGAVANFLESMRRELDFDGNDVLASTTSLSFDIAGLELFLPVLAGATALRLDRRAALDGAYLAESLRGRGVTAMQATPTTWSAVLGTGWTPSPHLKVLCGGERLPSALARELRSHGVRLWNLYGPTETTIWSSISRVTGDPITIGTPIANTDLYVVDAEGRLAPRGAVGELLIGGAGVARGYLNRPDLTAASFVPDVFGDRPGGRLYKTGDLARVREDGRFDVIGRRDHQVKVRGVRIELEEIEAEMAAHPAVRQSAVTTHNLDGATHLVGYFVAKAESGLTARALQSFLASRLPASMVPSILIEQSSLPQTIGAKVDRRRLPAPPTESAGLTHAFVEPTTDAERQLSVLWSEVLKRDRVSLDDDFFVLGGHSLRATILVSKIADAFGVRLPIATLFEHRTLGALAAHICSVRQHADAHALPALALDHAGRHEPFPLTEVQQAYFVGRTDAFQLGSVATHVYFEADVQDLDLHRFVEACGRLIARHEMLRVVFLPEGLQQILAEIPAFDVPEADLRALPDNERKARLDAVRAEMASAVLPIDQAPLLQIKVSRIDAHQSRIHMHVDNLIADASSLQLMLRELSWLYERPGASLPPLDLTFRDYVLAEDALRRSPAFDIALDYWRRKIDHLPPPPDLPVTRARASSEKQRSVRRTMRLPADGWQVVKKRAADLGVTPSGLLLTLYADVLAAWSSSPRFTVTVTLFNRLPLHPQVNDIVGDFTSVTLFECDASTGASLADRARRVQRELWADLEHRAVGGVRVLRELARARGGPSGAMMPVVFTGLLVDEPSERQRGGLIDSARVGFGASQTPQVWLDNQVLEVGGDLLCIWDAVDGIFEAGVLDDLFEAYVSRIRELASDESAWYVERADALPARQSQRRALINETTAPVSDRRLDGLVYERAVAQPDAVAVIAANGQLTYGELLARASGVAARLRDFGAARNELVGIVMGRGWEQPAAMLGTLLAGAAYVPIDASTPAHRLEWLLRHGGVRVVLTQSSVARDGAWPAGVTVLEVDRLPATAISTIARDVPRSCEDIAYVIYTSGSTGTPKGVTIDHRGAVNTILDLNERFGVTSDDRVLGVSSFTFDLSVYDVFGVLAAGGAVVIPADRDPAHWMDLVARHRVTIWNSVPALMGVVVEYLQNRPAPSLAPLRLVMMSGDWIPVGLPDQIRSVAPGITLMSLGGATEASIWSILYPIGEVPAAWPSIPYGRPMRNQRFYVLDDELRPRPDWVPGHLYIGGIGLALGYWRDAERTAQSFIQHPRTGERLYRTGDLGRYLPSGDIEFLGRRDFQVKVRGYRVELGEVQVHLQQHPDVQASAVIAVGDTTNRRLVAFVVPRVGAVVQPSQVIAHLQTRLPDYMVPSAVHAVDALPLTPNGKVDQNTLAGLATSAAEPRSAPTGGPGEDPLMDDAAIRECIHRAMCTILKVERLDDDANILERGATSIDMIRLANRLEVELQFRPRIDDFYRDPTLRGLLRLYGAAQVRTSAPSAATHKSTAANRYSIIRDPEARDHFKARRYGLRRLPNGTPTLRLERSRSEAERRRAYHARRSHRTFGREAVPLRDFGALLETLSEVGIDSHRLYPSAGGAYPIQTYLYVKPGGVEAVRAGTYYYDPSTHRLGQLAPNVVLDDTIHEPFVNRRIAETAAFSIFLVTQLEAIGPLYGELALPFSYLEAGYVSQVLMSAARQLGLGLCPIGSLDFAAVRDHFLLEDSHVLVHALFGGCAIEELGETAASDIDYRVDIVNAGLEESVV